jgi:hypothetical protein
MKAVIFKGPKEVVIEERPIPKIQDPTDIIIKVGYTALCGRYVLLHFLFSSVWDDYLAVSWLRRRIRELNRS